MRLPGALALVLTLTFLSATPALAQDITESALGSLTGAQIDAALTDEVTSLQTTRAELGALLAREEVRTVAEARGFDLEEARTALGSLSHQQASAAAPLVERLEAALRARDTITISVTTVIIILLLLILVT
ncbi:MAG: hypothetical protein WD960_01995 [Gemmatimonadota bacterium]